MSQAVKPLLTVVHDASVPLAGEFDKLSRRDQEMYATEVENAAARIAGRVRRTPVIATASATVWLKLEQLQHTGSFKPRGMFNRVLSARERGELPASGVIVASGGNAGLAVAHVAAELAV